MLNQKFRQLFIIPDCYLLFIYLKYEKSKTVSVTEL